MESIKRLRKTLGVSLEELARRTGMHRTAIARAERAGTDVKATTLVALARGLRVPMCELFDRKEGVGHGRGRTARVPWRR